MNVKISNLSKSYGENEVLKDINLTINSGNVCVLLGPSGSGKSTILNLIGGIETSEKGKIQIGNIDISNMDIYDLIINTDTFNPENVSEIIIQTLKVI